MSETTTEAPEATPETEQKPDTEQTPETDYKAEADKWKALARKHEEKAKANAEKAKGYDELRASQMTEQEKAVKDAEAKARTEAQREFAPRLVAAEFRIAAAGRMTGDQLDAFLEDLDLTKYLTESGDVDTERVTERIDKIAPKGDGKPVFPDLGQGKRQPSTTPLDPRAADLAQIEADLVAAKRR